MQKSRNKIVLLGLIAFGLLFTQAVFSQTEKLGIVKYTPPAGMSKLPKENTVAFNQYDQATGKFCIITLYGATPGTGNAKGDFAREWNNLVLKTFTTAEKNPSTESTSADGWTAIGGGAEVEGGVGKAIAFLTVISGFGQTVSVLGVFNDQSHAAKLDSFITALEMDKVKAPAAGNTTIATGPASAAFDAGGKLIIPQPSRQLTVVDLAGEWGEDAQRISTTYVYRSSGSYAGTDSLAFRSKMSFTRNGGYLNDFFAIRNGQKEIDKTVGTFTIAGRVLSLRHKGTAKYVIRGWLELDDMTILKVCGPWFDDGEIPERVFTDPEYGVNLEKIWVRKK